MGVNFLSMLEASFFSTFRIVFISFCGYLLVRLNVINKPIMKGVAEMTANFLIPCLSVAEICKSFKISEYRMWVPILVYCLLNVFMGYIIGLIVCMIVKPNRGDVRRLILIVCMFSNSTSMQLIYVDSLGGILASMIETTESEAKSKGYVIVLIYTIFVNFIRWSIGFNMMKPDNEQKNLDNLDTTEDKVMEIKQMRDSVSSLSTAFDWKINESPKSQIWKVLKEGINMPFMAGLVAILISSIPYVSDFFSDKSALGYKLLVESCEAVGKCVSTFVILILGLNLSLSLNERNENDGYIDKYIFIAILFAKSIIFPILGLFAVYTLGFQLNFITDPLQAFLLLTNFCTPTAINMITIAIINKFQVENLSKLLLAQYIIGTVTVTLWTAVYLNLLM